MENKQTAVEWLEEQFAWNELMPKWIYDYLQEAKQMEKKQMIEFADRYGFDVCHYDYDRAEEYYERTYKQQ
jgi:hypothetical protein